MAQFARPNSNVTLTNMDATASYVSIDEGVADDADYGYSVNNTTAEWEVGLSAVTDPAVSTGHIIRLRYARSDDDASPKAPQGGGSSSQISIILRQGTTQIASFGPYLTDSLGNWSNSEYTLSASEADAITDYTDLRLEFNIVGGGGSPTNRRGVAISWAEMEVPSAGTQFNQTLNGGLSFSGALTKRPGKALAGGLSFTGSISKKTSMTLAGGLSFAGALTKLTEKAAIAADLSFSGALGVSRLFSKTLAGTLSFSGSLARETRKSLSGGLSFAGSLVKETAKPLAAALSFSGGLAKETQKALSGGLSFVGDLASSKVAVVVFNAALSFSGSLVKQAQKPLAGALSFTGGLTKEVQKSLAGGLTFVGSMTKEAQKSIAASLSFTGSLTKQTVKDAFAAGLSFVGNLVTEYFPVGGGPQTYFETFNAALSFTGALAKETQKTFSGGLSFAGGLTRQTQKALSGGLSFVGDLATRKSQVFLKTFNASLSFSGELLAGSLAIAGSALTHARNWVVRNRRLGRITGLRPRK